MIRLSKTGAQAAIAAGAAVVAVTLSVGESRASAQLPPPLGITSF